MHFLRRENALIAAGVIVLISGGEGCAGGGAPKLPTIEPAIVTPPAGAVVDAVEWGTRDLAIARTPGHTTVQVVDGQGHGVDGLTIRIDDHATTGCGQGCYAADAAEGPVTVETGSRLWRFTVPATAPSANGVIWKAMAAYARLRSVALHQHLASSPTNSITTSFLFVAPDRLRYRISDGSQSIVIGKRRWDRAFATDKWVESPQARTQVMKLPWSRAIDAHIIRPSTVTFFDLTTRAWFRVAIDRQTSLPTTVRMTGISHFMVNSYSSYNNTKATVVPPPPTITSRS